MNDKKEQRNLHPTQAEARDYIADMLIDLACIAKKAQIVEFDSLLIHFSKIIREQGIKKS